MPTRKKKQQKIMPKLKPSLEKNIERIASETIKGKKYTPNQYKRKITRMLKD